MFNHNFWMPMNDNLHTVLLHCISSLVFQSMTTYFPLYSIHPKDIAFIHSWWLLYSWKWTQTIMSSQHMAHSLQEVGGIHYTPKVAAGFILSPSRAAWGLRSGFAQQGQERLGQKPHTCGYISSADNMDAGKSTALQKNQLKGPRPPKW